MEPGVDGAWHGEFLVRFFRRPFRPGFRRGRGLSRQHESGSRVVPPEGTSFGHWNFQRRNERRRSDYAAGCAVDHRYLGLALGVRPDWRDRCSVAGSLAVDLPQAGGAPPLLAGRVALYSKRSNGSAGEGKLVRTAGPPADLGVRNWQVPD